jgi:hypothetical protein
LRLHPGETKAIGWQVMTLPDAVRRLRAAAPGVAGRPRVIAIDGRGGAGKTTLAERLRSAIPNSVVVHTDDVAWNHAYFDWGAVLAENVLQPVHRGEAVDFRPTAWSDHDRPGSITVAAGADVVWVEGTGIIREELAPWLDAGIWLQGDLTSRSGCWPPVTATPPSSGARGELATGGTAIPPAGTAVGPGHHDRRRAGAHRSRPGHRVGHRGAG